MGPQSVSVMVSPPAATATVSANPLTCTIPQNQGTCTIDFTWNISNAGSPNLFNFTTGSIYSNSPSGNSVAYPITHGMNRIEAREGGIPIMGADVTVNGFCGALDIWDGMTSTCISAGCTQTVFCTDYTTEVGNTCQGADYSFTDNCGDAHLCPGTRSCNYNWKEIAP